jgi:hypothetical protein
MLEVKDNSQEQITTNPTKIVLMHHKVDYKDHDSMIPQNVRDYITQEDPDILTVDGLNRHLLESVRRYEDVKSRDPNMEITPDMPSWEWINSIAAIRPQELRENQTLVFADFPAEVNHLMFSIEGFKGIHANTFGDGEVTLPKAIRPLLNALSTPTAYSLLVPAAYLAMKKSGGKVNKDTDMQQEKGLELNTEMSRRKFLQASAVGLFSIVLGRYLVEKQPSLDLVKILNTTDFFDLQDAWLDLRNIKMRMANQQEVEEAQKTNPDTKSIVLLGTAHAHTLDSNVNSDTYDMEKFKIEARGNVMECIFYMRKRFEEAGIEVTEPIKTITKQLYSEYSTIKRDSNGQLIQTDTSIHDIDMIIDTVFSKKSQ